jgi:hypothetical protein
MMARKAPRPPYTVLLSERPDPIRLPEWQRSLRRYLADRDLERSGP